MAENSKQGFISLLREWVKKYYITIINSSVMVVLIGIATFVLLSRSSSLQRKTAEESVVNLAGMTANEVQSDYLTYYDVVRTISQIMTSYQSIEVERRRPFFNDIMLGILTTNRNFINLYTIWRPEELDGMDERYANTFDSDETGQYITGFTRENGWIEKKAFSDYKYLLNIYNDYLSGFITSTIGEPVPKKVGDRDTWVIDIQLPIMEKNTAVGIIGATVNLEQLQNLIESKRPYETGRTLVCSNNGNIVAHYNPQLRGVDIRNSEIHDPLFSAGVHGQVFQVIIDSMTTLKPAAFTYSNTLIVSYPLKTTNPRLATFSSGESTNPPWSVVTLVPLPTILSPINALLRFSVLFVIGAGILAALVVFLTSSRLTQHARFLQHDLERATTMQDNLKYGLFLMDQKYIIQSAYSKALEKILSVSNLQGKSFMEMIAPSIKASEQAGLVDYFEMVFKRSFDRQMLEDINPLDVFTYVSAETGETKSLRSSFTIAEWGRGTPYILCTLEDITAEKELEKQLLNVETQREKEMQSLFQVIQLNPRVLSDFIEDAEYEFDHINAMLKNKKNYNREILVEMYQSIHAIKSNALILNLEEFSAKLHKLEGSIKNLQEKEDGTVTFDDFLGLILELNDVMNEKDQLKAAISKIENFRNMAGKEINQEQYVLVETLTQVCKKAQTALNKSVRFTVEGIDEIALEKGPRRVIKEVLTQLVRNAVYHGIESPEEREAAEKESEGEIRLSIRQQDDEIVIKLTDNGKGIDFNHVRERAMEKNLFSSPEEANEKNNLLKMIFSPGFSTLDSADLHAGRGIGLSLVRDRIKALNGNINITTAAGKGTTFTITFPLNPEETVNAS